MRFYLIFFFFIPVFAFAQPGNLTILAESGEKFILFLDDIRQNEKPVSVIKVEALNSPFYSVRIKFSDSSLKSIDKKNITIVDVNEVLMDAVYHLKSEKPGKPKLQLYSMTPVNQAEIIKDAFIIRAGIPKPVEPAINPGKIVVDRAKGLQKEVGVPAAIKPDSPKSAAVKKCNGWPLAKEDFDKLKLLVAEARNESAKLKAAKNIAAGNCLLVSQILQICSLFLSEVAKLEFAEYVFQYTLDRQNFSRLKELFKEPSLRAKIDNISVQR